jgi:GNAT superfamily N-acetyltransferase
MGYPCNFSLIVCIFAGFKKTSMQISVRPAVKADLPAIHALVYELAVFEHAPDSHTATIADYEKDYDAGIFQVHVAETIDNQIIGMIFYHIAYSTWRGRQMYLEDFVVTAAYRRFGVGQLLFSKMVEIARLKGCRLLKWQVLDWNTDAIEFYKKQNAEIENNWLTGKCFFIKPDGTPIG